MPLRILRPNARTVAIARFLRAAAPEIHRRRGGRLPRQQQPDAIRLSYYKSLAPIVHDANRALRAVGPTLLHLLDAENRIRASLPVHDRMDASDRERAARKLVEDAGRKAADAFRPTAVERAAREAARRTGDFNREQFAKQATQALGIPYMSIEKPTRLLVPNFISENVSLVKTLPERYHDRLEKVVRRAFEKGQSVETLADKISELDDISDSDAIRIARDQIGKLNGQFNQERQEALGLDRYVWRTMNDNRVRDEHSDREGESFAWTDPPEGGHPGEDIQCRCYAEPDFSGIISEF